MIHDAMTLLSVLSHVHVRGLIARLLSCDSRWNDSSLNEMTHSIVNHTMKRLTPSCERTHMAKNRTFPGCVLDDTFGHFLYENAFS